MLPCMNCKKINKFTEYNVQSRSSSDTAKSTNQLKNTETENLPFVYRQNISAFKTETLFSI